LSGHVFDDLPKWIHEASPRTRDLWAPDVSFEHGEFRLYYAYSLFGKNTSGIGLATNATMDPKSPRYKWVDRGLVVTSTTTDNYNAIDPNFLRDRQGREWLSFGSFWSGIKMRELDPKDGKLLATNPVVYSVASRAKRDPMASPEAKLPPDAQAIEAPYIVHHGQFYYLFVSWDLCCRGAKSTYRTMVGRSSHPTGPYVDRNSKPMEGGGGSQIVGPNDRWAGAGGESVLLQRSAPDLLFFHAYDKVTGRPSLEVATISWQDGWPVIAGN
jgi:arabinan endo-1,5-alpha-L-arabinosidase